MLGYSTQSSQQFGVCREHSIRAFLDCQLLATALKTSLLIFNCLAMSNLSYAEEGALLLKIQGDLIGKIEQQHDISDTEQFIDSYYALLPREKIDQVQLYRNRLSGLIPRYKIAYTAADSAELAELMDEISMQWGFLKNLHDEYFTGEVSSMLSAAYDKALEDISDSNSSGNTR